MLMISSALATTPAAFRSRTYSGVTSCTLRLIRRSDRNVADIFRRHVLNLHADDFVRTGNDAGSLQIAHIFRSDVLHLEADQAVRSECRGHIPASRPEPSC